MKPGTYIVNPFVTISEAIKYAGGLQQNASIRTITVNKVNGNSKSSDLYDFLINGDRSQDISLQNGDTVVVSSTNNFVPIDGLVSRPFNYEYLNSDTFLDLITYAGVLQKMLIKKDYQLICL